MIRQQLGIHSLGVFPTISADDYANVLLTLLNTLLTAVATCLTALIAARAIKQTSKAYSTKS